MTWTCEQIEAQLTEYLDGALPTEVQSGFDAHVASCSRCAALVQTVRGMVSAMRALEPLPVPPGLTTRILEQTTGLAAAEKNWRSAWFGWTRFVFAPKFAYGVLTVFITMIVLSQALGMKMHRPTIADLSPVSIYRTVNRQAHLMYARSSKFVADLRVVYEIQSRLAPANENQPASASPSNGTPAGTGHSEKNPDAPRHQNRISTAQFPVTYVASALMFAPARSAR
jgi:anti-sigma factor RsiW